MTKIINRPGPRTSQLLVVSCVALVSACAAQTASEPTEEGGMAENGATNDEGLVGTGSSAGQTDEATAPGTPQPNSGSGGAGAFTGAGGAGEVLGTGGTADASGGAGAVTVDEPGAFPSSRDPWLWPFAADSIWNIPLGASADYRPANLRQAAHVGVDIQHLLKTTNQDPETEVHKTYGFGAGRCSSSDKHDFTLRVPESWIVPDAGNSPYGGTPNSNFAFLQPDGETVFEGVLVSRCTAGGPVHLPDFYQWPNNRSYQSLRGNGLEGGGQGASYMSALGGTIRKGELTGTEPIRHAVKINPYGATDLYYSAQMPGFKWPAVAADSYAAGTYKGTNPLIVMGSLLAIAPDVTPESIGLQTVAGKKLFFTLQNYGLYFVEDAAWDTWDLIIERDAELEFESTYGFSLSSGAWKDELNRLMAALSVIANNGPSTPGGGGTPRQPLAPSFE